MMHFTLRLAGPVALAMAIACSASPPPSLTRVTDRDSGADATAPITASTSDTPRTELPKADPHALLGVEPAHGSFVGGQTRLVRGNGFTPGARIWFAGTEVNHAQVVFLDAQKLSVVVPPGAPGPADVMAQLGDDVSTQRALPAGYAYDAFYLDPESGPTSGGTELTLHGAGTRWASGTTVSIGGVACENVQVLSPVRITCMAPKGEVGARAVQVMTPSGSTDSVLDAFAYANSDNGFRGGLSGQALGSRVQVIALNSYTGDALPGATVFASAIDGSSPHATTDSAGVALLQGGGWGKTTTVTVAAKCFQPATFVDVPVDTVTVYLDPILSPDCVPGGDPPSVGGSFRAGARITGELVWSLTPEFRRADWANVPLPQSATEKRVAYVAFPTGRADAPFDIPSPSEAVYESDTGKAGYKFQILAPVGNLALYAVAGIEDRATPSAPKFTAYAMGIAQGIATQPGNTTEDVVLTIDLPLDHRVELAVDAPASTARGPDRGSFNIAVSYASYGFLAFPAGRHDQLLPVQGKIAAVGLPPLSASLAEQTYVITAKAGTGPSLTTPYSVVQQLRSTNSNEPLTVNGFVPVPILEYPAANQSWDGRHLKARLGAGNAPAELLIIDVSSGDGLIHWSISGPASSLDIALPDLQGSVPGGALLSGPLEVQLTAAHLDPFSYASLKYQQLSSARWLAHAVDTFSAHLP